MPVVVGFCIFTGLFRVLPAARAGRRAASPGALFAVIGLVLLRVAAEAYIDLFGEAGAVYGTIGVVLGLVYFVYLGAIIVVYSAHVAAEASRVPGGAAIDRAIEAERVTQRPLGRELLGLLRALFVRPRPRRRGDDDGPAGGG